MKLRKILFTLGKKYGCTAGLALYRLYIYDMLGYGVKDMAGHASVRDHFKIKDESSVRDVYASWYGKAKFTKESLEEDVDSLVTMLEMLTERKL